MAKDDTKNNSGHVATAKALDLSVSTKHCIEICRSLRYKKTSFAKKFLEDVADLKKAVPFRRFNKDLGHKAGMSSGRFPRNAAKEILKLINSVEANAQVKGLNSSNLKITKILANKAAIPLTGGRHRTGTKRTHVEVEVRESKVEGKTQRSEASSASKEKLSAEVEVRKEESKKKESKKTETMEAKPTPSVQKEEAKIEKTTAPKDLPEEKQELVKEELVEQEPVTQVFVQPTSASTPVEESSPAELLKKAQKKAEELNKKEKEAEKTKEVSDLYKELQKKGSLRHKRDAQ